ncbi:hypothetical protein HNP38_001023 [Chryseobacterium defluvii]|uniref:DUF4377 domain-containing protein n=1 Tax=Chryseobacterium defluvii TaxID=160396 RepID=A0A840K8D0_9FLAO|nr:DUF4377 domain-containing protein [Chryseobacterium defluvii]MBB4805751.1 hypothetical protein [Chryseobacterium defluvii]
MGQKWEIVRCDSHEMPSGKRKPADIWTNFYSNIEGITYESGYEYVLKVKTAKIADPPADGSSIRYILVKQVSRTQK